MPYFKWKGVNLVGEWHYGRLFARTQEELSNRLVQQNIALIKCWPVRMWFAPRVTTDACAQLFFDLATLCESGILLPKALEVVGLQLYNPRLQQIVLSIASLVQDGTNPTSAFLQYPNVFSSFVVSMIDVGHRAGAMPHVLGLLAKHLDATHKFSKKVRAALIAPMCTMLVFLLVFLFIFIYIVPSFAAVFLSVGHEVPTLTKIMIAISDWMLSMYALASFIVLLCITFLLRYWLISDQGQYWKDKRLSRAPFIGITVQLYSVGKFCKALSLLLQGGSTIITGVTVAQGAVNNKYMQKHIQLCGAEIASGKSLTQALRLCLVEMNVLDVLHIIQAGECSGKLACMLERAASICEQRVADQLTVIQALVQPAIMLLLGLLVSFLIFAIYVPIFNLSGVIAP